MPHRLHPPRKRRRRQQRPRAALLTRRPEAHARGPLAIPLSGGTLWLFATVFFALVLYYFIGVDQGATSIFGHDRHIHEFVHDGRHVLAFPCH